MTLTGPREPPIPLLDGETSGAWVQRIQSETEPTLGPGAFVIVETVIKVKARLRAAAAAGSPAAPDRPAPPALGASANFASPPPLPETLASLGAALQADIPIVHLASHCHGIARAAEATGARLTSFLFARFAWEASAQRAPDPFYIFEMARHAVAVPELAELGREWLTRAALEARRTAKWEVVALAATALAELMAMDADGATADSLLKFAAKASARARSQACPTDTGGRG